MIETTTSLRRKILSAGELQSVVRAMKALAASNITQYERSVSALADYCRAVELGLGACFRASGDTTSQPVQRAGNEQPVIGAVVFGSDQGLVGRFNEVVADAALTMLAKRPGMSRVWAVGERVRDRLTDGGRPPVMLFTVPSSIEAIAALVGEILVATDAHSGGVTELHLFYNRPADAPDSAFTQRLLPLDEHWRLALATLAWPTPRLPQVMGEGTTTLRALIREYLFISLFRACAESLASENARRLAAMQRADKNIDDSLEQLGGTFDRLRQSGIDDELFDVISGFEALSCSVSQL